MISSWENNIYSYSTKQFWVLYIYWFKFISKYSYWLNYNCMLCDKWELKEIIKTILVKDISICLSCPDDVPSYLEIHFSWSFQSQQHWVDGNQDCHSSSWKRRRDQLREQQTSELYSIVLFQYNLIPLTKWKTNHQAIHNFHWHMTIRRFGYLVSSSGYTVELLSIAFKKLTIRDNGGTKFSNYNPTKHSEISISRSSRGATSFHIYIKLTYWDNFQCEHYIHQILRDKTTTHFNKIETWYIRTKRDLRNDLYKHFHFTWKGKKLRHRERSQRSSVSPLSLPPLLSGKKYIVWQWLQVGPEKWTKS